MARCKRYGARPASAPRSESPGKMAVLLSLRVLHEPHALCRSGPGGWAEQARRLLYLPALPLTGRPGAEG